MESEFQNNLNELVDIAVKPKGRYTEEKAHKHLNEQMMKSGKAKTTGFESRNTEEQDWTDDMRFYIDQKGPREMHMEGIDGRLALKEKRKQSKEMHQSSSSKSATTTTTGATRWK